MCRSSLRLGGRSAPRNFGSISRSVSPRRLLQAAILNLSTPGCWMGKAHPTSGRATIYQVGDGKRDLRLTDFATSNGPDVHVLLAQSADQNLTKEFVKGDLDSLELGLLKANQGDQNYDLPDSVDLQKYDSVVIYCERFHAVFGVAKLERF